MDLCVIKDDPPQILSSGGLAISTPRTSEEVSKELLGLLARTPLVRDACDLDLLVFLHRHPRSFLTSEMVAAFVGYDIKQIAKSLDAFVDAGLLERTQNPMHAARLYLLLLDGPEGEALRALLKVASTREGRQNIVRVWARTDPGAAPKKSLLKIA